MKNNHEKQDKHNKHCKPCNDKPCDKPNHSRANDCGKQN